MMLNNRIFKNSLLLVCFITGMACCQMREHWYLFRVEVNATGQSDEIGCGAGLLWSLKELDEPPCDAFGVGAGIAALNNAIEYIPCARVGATVRWGFLCTRIRYSLYKPKETDAVSVINPQIGLSYQSIVSLFAGYNQSLFRRSIKGLEKSICRSA
jgi:hypothetical protein